MSDFVSLYTAFSGLQAAQAGLETVTDNIANVATPGRTRRTLRLIARRPHMTPYGPQGTGVDVADVERARNRFLDIRVRAGVSAFGRLSVRADLLGRMEEAFGESGLGVGDALDDLWAAFEDLSLDPPDLAARSSVISALEEATRRIRTVALDWQNVAQNAREETDALVTEVNGLLTEIGDLNVSIVEATADAGSPGHLLDRRDQVIDQLSELAGVSVTQADDGTIRVSINGRMLVDRAVVIPLQYDSGTNEVSLTSTGEVVDPGGELAGYLGVIGTDVPNMTSEIDAFVVDLVDAVNTAHNAGYDPSGAAGADLLTYTPGGAALTVSVAMTDPNGLAAAGDPGPPFPTFDGTNAEALSGLRTALVAAGGTQSLNASFRAVVVSSGSGAASAMAAAEAQAALHFSAETARLNSNGVSLDEEMAMMMQYQRSYEAAARVMNAVDEALELVVNRLGLVGR